MVNQINNCTLIISGRFEIKQETQCMNCMPFMEKNNNNRKNWVRDGADKSVPAVVMQTEFVLQ